jgi:SAM-dependent methyltransferase
MTPAERFWETHYRQHERAFGGRANPVLVDVATPLAPGHALELGCGEGGDAIWLARRGWRVTAVDVSATALGRVREHAEPAGVGERVDVERHDLGRSFPGGSFDLVCAQYLQSPVALPREQVRRAAARAVGPGGLLLLVDHASVSPWSWSARAEVDFPTPQEELDALALDLEGWNVERLEAPEREATGPSGETAIVRDTVLALRRRG